MNLKRWECERRYNCKIFFPLLFFIGVERNKIKKFLIFLNLKINNKDNEPF